jgi:PIN domain nuclease of toxin-antitoxin system
MSATFLLDTCAWLDAFATPELLRPAVRKLLAGERIVHVSAISLLEVAGKEAKGELVFDRSLAKWFECALPTRWVRVLGITPEIAIDATRLPAWDHKDPGARIVVATARLHGLKVLTSDSRILQYPHVGSVASRKA